VSSVSPSILARKFFGKKSDSNLLPNLIETQKISYQHFLNAKCEENTAYSLSGLKGVLKSVFPIHCTNNKATLEYVDDEMGEPKFDVEECKRKSISYSAPLWVTLRLILWEYDENSNHKDVKSIKEQKVYFGDIPLMTETGTFIINGIERVVVSQMHRAPGVILDNDKGKTHSSGKYLYNARIIPYRGSWLDFEFDVKDLIYFRIDKKKKLYVTTLLRALGMSNNEILDIFYNKLLYSKTEKGWVTQFNPDLMRGVKLGRDLINADTMDIIAKTGVKLTPRLTKKFQSEGLKNILVTDEDLQGKFIAQDLINEETGEVYFEAGDELAVESLALIDTVKVKNFQILHIEVNKIGPYIRDTMFADRIQSKQEALLEIYKIIRPGELPTVEAAENLFHNLFFDRDRYDLSPVGRVKLNSKLNLDLDENFTVLTKEDIVGTIKKLVEVRDGEEEIDDIDHLSNRRVRSVGELMENQIRIGLVRFEKNVNEKMLLADSASVMPQEFVSSKMISNIIRDFFGSSQLSQFMDQTNPLSEITHKRRLSALGPGGLSRERAGFEVRDVHPTHYGRICPIETPEGQNIGLINSMATFAKVNKYGFIETPYRKVVEGQVTDQVHYLSAIEESKYVIAQANAPLDEDKKFIDELVSCRKKGEFIMANPDRINYMDVSPMQLVSVAASLIPFLENDDANRALMGSNMQRQAVPLVYTEAPFIGTGMEKKVAQDSGATVLAKRDGRVESLDSTRIVIKAPTNIEDDTGVDIYNLRKFQRSNHNTCINQKPIVKVGQIVKAGEVIADGPCTERGELALGKNVLVAFMPWNGYNFEDSILISERIVKDDVFTSVHIEEFEVVARDTRLGPEELTRDIPNISEQGLRHLDEVGIVHIGAEVKAGDILVGKVTPKSESPITAEEKLLRAIFGEKASDVRDSSLRLPPGVAGTVVDVRVFTRRGIEKNQRALTIEREEIENLSKDKNDRLSVIEVFIYNKLKALLLNQIFISGAKGITSGTKIDSSIITDFTKKELWDIIIDSSEIMSEREKLKKYLDSAKVGLERRFNEKVEKIKVGDDLPHGALKVVKIFVAVKQKLQPGDKMAGRHGNKGVVSRIAPEEDMPYLEDGTIIDIVLNPLGVPSRMNAGQILETHLGRAVAELSKEISKKVEEYKNNITDIQDIRSKLTEIYEGDEEILQYLKSLSEKDCVVFAEGLKKGIHIATPVFNGAKEADINQMLSLAGLNQSGQVKLLDGRTGEYFDRPVTVGYIYMLKLHHLVEDKIHARSVGPYSLVTQQPLGGKSHFGGQRFGEMECWALQAYGAAFTLQEMLTVKSDDVIGRVKIYDSIIQGEQNFESGIPESFHVMVKEVKALCLNIELQRNV
jgi:DNA-directed RNA polymerase subunit beta